MFKAHIHRLSHIPGQQVCFINTELNLDTVKSLILVCRQSFLAIHLSNAHRLKSKVAAGGHRITMGIMERPY